MSLLLDPLSFHFFRSALLAALLASITCGIVGTFVVTKRIASVSGGLSHAAIGGVGIGHFFGFAPLLGASLFSAACACIIGVLYRQRHGSLDTLIALMWSLGMAVGILLIALTPGFAPDLASYLFGNILFVSDEFLILTGVLDIAILAAVLVLYKELQAIAFDEEFSEVCGVPVTALFLLLLLLVSFSVVVLIRVVGVVLTISLLTTPAVIARQWSNQLPRMMLLSAVCCGVCSSLGLFLSYYLSETQAVKVPTGPLIIVLVSLLYLASLILQRRNG